MLICFQIPVDSIHCQSSIDVLHSSTFRCIWHGRLDAARRSSVAAALFAFGDQPRSLAGGNWLTVEQFNIANLDTYPSPGEQALLGAGNLSLKRDGVEWRATRLPTAL